MTTLALHIIVAGAENHPPMLEKSMDDYGQVVYVYSSKGRNMSFTGTGNKGIATTSRGNYTASQPRVVKCYNCQGHMARQYTRPKRTRNSAWFKEKLMLAEAQKAGKILDEEQLAFLVDPGTDEAPW
uniref:Retrovirus-related Pol polyprotein from transposon TNT 1-94 n=1 Tax=Tanacetum cinerariifolium TaxID=118510 RepID=A0A6L2MJ56_TANCI|nr:hypothetical protein [Tanacetum cinerariifolium]